MNGPPYLLAARIAPTDRLERAIVAFEPGERSPREDLDIGQPRNTIDQIARHAGAEIRSTHQKPHFLRLACEIDGGLACRIAAADEGYLLARGYARFDRAALLHLRYQDAPGR